MRRAKLTEAGTLRAVCDWLDKTNQVWLRHSPSNVVGKKGEATFRRIRDSQRGAPDVIWFKARTWIVVPDDPIAFVKSQRGCQPIAIEVKSPTGKQSKDQLAWQKRFETVGGTYWVIREIDEFLGRVK